MLLISRHPVSVLHAYRSNDFTEGTPQHLTGKVTYTSQSYLWDLKSLPFESCPPKRSVQFPFRLETISQPRWLPACTLPAATTFPTTNIFTATSELDLSPSSRPSSAAEI